MPGRSVVVFLHGSGDTGANLLRFLSVVPMMTEEDGSMPFASHLRRRGASLVCPSAKTRVYHGAGPGEQAMSVWFDRRPDWTRTGVGGVEDTEGTEDSLRQVRSNPSRGPALIACSTRCSRCWRS